MVSLPTQRKRYLVLHAPLLEKAEREQIVEVSRRVGYVSIDASGFTFDQVQTFVRWVWFTRLLALRVIGGPTNEFWLEVTEPSERSLVAAVPTTRGSGFMRAASRIMSLLPQELVIRWIDFDSKEALVHLDGRFDREIVVERRAWTPETKREEPWKRVASIHRDLAETAPCPGGEGQCFRVVLKEALRSDEWRTRFVQRDGE